MDFGVNTRFLLFQGLTCIPVLLWLGLSVAALLSLRKHSMNEIARVLWVAVIVAVPVLGALAFWIVSPAERQGGVG